MVVGSELALTYNDVQWRVCVRKPVFHCYHHLAVTFKHLQDDDCDKH